MLKSTVALHCSSNPDKMFFQLLQRIFSCHHSQYNVVKLHFCIQPISEEQCAATKQRECLSQRHGQENYIITNITDKCF